MKPRTLTGKFVAIMVVAAMSMAILAATVSYQVTRRRADAEARAAIEGLMTAIENSIATGTYARDPILLSELVTGLVRHPLVDFAQVQDAGLATLAIASDTPAVEAPVDGITMSRTVKSPFYPDENIGLMHVHVDAAHLRASVRQQALLLGLALAGLITALALLLNAVALRLLVRPMSQLARELHAMEAGTANRVSAIGTHASDEIGTVVRAANRLLDANQGALDREREMSAEIASMEARYRQIFDYTSAGIFLLTPQCRLVNSNRAISRLIGATDLELTQLQHTDFIQRLFVDAAHVREMVETALRTHQTTSADLEVRCCDRRIRWVHCLISVQEGGDEETGGHLIEGVIYDVTQRRLVESETAYLAEHDALTGLKSRAFFHRVLHHYVERARTIHTSVTLIFVDLDQFKSVNDTYGHEAGDRVLVECARRLQDMIHRNADLAVRLGGDEFTVVLDGVGAEETQAQELARRIVKSMMEPIEIGAGVRVRIGASVGLASFPLHAGSSEELLRTADKAMYEAKRVGKSAFRTAPSLRTG